MTKIIEKKKKTDVHLHIDKAYEVIYQGLPSNYTEKVLKLLSNEKDLTSGIIRNIKCRITQYPSTRINVLNALVTIAKEYQLEIQSLKELTK